MQKFNAQQLRTLQVDSEAIKTIKKQSISIILDNVLDTYNIGSIFRLADALAVEKVYLCGQTETPPNSKIKKASVNTWQWVDWEYVPTAVEAIAKCRLSHADCQIVAVEQDERSVPFQKAHYQLPLTIIVGNESYGVSKEALDMVDSIVELPMFGINTSLNVMVSCGIVLYEAIQHT